jgi:hypothetical protein
MLGWGDGQLVNAQTDVQIIDSSNFSIPLSVGRPVASSRFITMLWLGGISAFGSPYKFS